MPNMNKMVDNQVREMTDEEQADYDARTTAWNDDAPNRRMAELRKQRDVLLAETDWIVIKSRESNTNVPANWKTYRQSLRDITTQTPSDDDLSNITFPTKPTE